MKETDARQTRSQSALKDSPLYTLEQVQEIVEGAVAASTERILEAHNAKISALQKTISALEDRVRVQETKNNNLEQYSRRSHLRIRGLDIPEGADCKAVVVQFVNTKLRSKDQPITPITTADIDAAHPLPVRKPPRNADADTDATGAKIPANPPRPVIIVRFHQRDIRDRIIRARRSLKRCAEKFSVQEDLTAQNFALLRKLSAREAVDSAWSWQGKIFARLAGESKARRFDIHDPLP